MSKSKPLSITARCRERCRLVPLPQRIAAGDLREAISQSATLQQALLRYAYAFMIQTTQTALANGRSKIEERLGKVAADGGWSR
jgi:hypothetical protein